MSTKESPQALTIEENWARSDQYHNSFLIRPDETLDFALKNSAEHGLPSIAVSTSQGKYLNLLARSIGAKRILEVGTLGGYSTIWLARALPEDGKLITFEIDKTHADVAQANINHAGVSSKVQIILGPATDTLAKVERHPDHPFDLAFIDADKENNLTYFLEAKRLLRKGGVIIVDNVVRRGRVADPEVKDESSEGVRKLLRHLKDDRDVDATTIAWVGEKSYDGFLYALLK
ncbi:O-methyltransferase family 3 protein [Cristinia sonorae]|uniref:O-methyltransferase family 3 protein n=1 Tax=Cristinia sonorae TaxID=1940300 RepID=A0A8K0UMR0_9AGAR|nr:O-methyltransferase family 3 protein [Cristinia sonorae]